ncbi:MAG: NAD+ synthase [Hyphomonadaceae bacterium]|nr:NAD+ synthase [Hyphomonadaceae bacterium]MBC6412770.1 NAD+ synthase [Hyphomonadaceae bacterium]
MIDTLRIASAQLNPIVGDLDGNLTKATTAFRRARSDAADILVLPEQFIIGYPAEDLVLKTAVVEDCRKCAEHFAKLTGDGPAVVFNLPWREGGLLYNTALFMQDGQITDVRYKYHLPNYGVFDEARVFARGPLPEPVDYRGVKIGLPICEDLWQPDVAGHLADGGAELLISPNGSPWRRTVLSERVTTIGAKVHNEGLPLIYVNQVGGQDELVFDGSSFAMNRDGDIVQSLRSFVEDYDVSRWHKQSAVWQCTGAACYDPLGGLEADWRAICLGLGDYVRKNGFKQVILGLSGGIDSAMVATIAADALGAEAVWCVMMPSLYTSGDSLGDAGDIAGRLGVRYDVIPVEPAFDAFMKMLKPHFEGTEPDMTEENIQSRIRALSLMALSNKFGPMLITTGNKSEMATGYTTLYGDMCGGYNPLQDVYKTEVFELAHWRNAHNPEDLLGVDNPIPDNIITKPPSAELRDNQKDSDSLPEYDRLDDILLGLIEREEPLETIIARGHDEALVRRIQHLLYIAEYKRRQAPPGAKIGTRNFGRDRRYPVTNRYRDAARTR